MTDTKFGYGVDGPYISPIATQSQGNFLVFVSNGDGTGELYPCDVKGLPDLAHQLAGIRSDAPGLFVAYDTDGNREEPMDQSDAYEALTDGYMRDGIRMFQAIKTIPSGTGGLWYAASIKYLREQGVWVTITYAHVDDGYHGRLEEFNNAIVRKEMITRTIPEFTIRALQYRSFDHMEHVLCAI